jgi:hypothetical protein
MRERGGGAAVAGAERKESWLRYTALQVTSTDAELKLGGGGGEGMEIH